MKWVMTSAKLRSPETNFFMFDWFFSTCKVAGCEIIVTDVSPLITRRRDFGWLKHVGGITFPSSQSSSTLCSFCWERRTNMYQRFMWYIMEWCHLAVSFNKSTFIKSPTFSTWFWFFSVWMGMKFAPGGHSTFFAMLNAFVHIVMYFYYMIAAMGPKYQKFIWWKKYLTAFQMVSFAFRPLLSHSIF